MAKLVACRACRASISAAAPVCPFCGHPAPKRTGLATWIIGGLFTFIVGSCVINVATRPDRVEPPPKTEEQKKTDAIREQQEKVRLAKTSAVAASLKSASKDPESFDLKSATYQPDGSICVVYRARNSFNAMLQGSAVATPTNQIFIQEKDGNRFVNAWNKGCLSSGFDYTSETQILIK